MNYKEQLIKDILPFWLKNGIDEKGAIYEKEKSVWFQGRALWTFSYTKTLYDNGNFR